MSFIIFAFDISRWPVSYFSEKAFEARGVSLCAYLIALAGFQMGLRVTFYNDPKVAGVVTSGSDPRGTVFSLSDDENLYFFLRSRGGLTSQQAHKNSINKGKTKELLLMAGVRTPRGVTLEKKTALEDDSLFARFGCPEVVVKPVAGSLGRGVTTGIKSQIQLVEALTNIQVNKVVLEEHVEGEEYRYYVAGGRVVAVTGREAANVVGDGLSTLRDLIRKKNRVRARNPHLSSRKIKLDKATLSFLKSQGYGLADVPARDRKIYLSSAANLSRGGDSIDATDVVSEQSKEMAVAAAHALKIPNAGIDIINVVRDGVEYSYVIELNSQAHIGSHSFPMQGGGQNNKVAESIVKSYFPSKVEKIADDVYFDFSHVKASLGTGAISGVSLPVLNKDMVKRKLKFFSHTPPDVVVKQSQKLMKQLGCFGEVHYFGRDSFLIRLFGVRKKNSRFLPRLAKRLEGFSIVEEGVFKCPVDTSVRAVDHRKSEMSKSEVSSSRLIIRGKVQRVGYRKWLKLAAEKKSVNGWVRNRADGTVEALLSGDVVSVAELIEDCREGSAGSVVENVSSKRSRVIPKPGFRVRATLKSS